MAEIGEEERRQHRDNDLHCSNPYCFHTKFFLTIPFVNTVTFKNTYQKRILTIYTHTNCSQTRKWSCFRLGLSATMLQYSQDKKVAPLKKVLYFKTTKFEWEFCRSAKFHINQFTSSSRPEGWPPGLNIIIQGIWFHSPKLKFLQSHSLAQKNMADTDCSSK